MYHINTCISYIPGVKLKLSCTLFTVSGLTCSRKVVQSGGTGCYSSETLPTKVIPAAQV